MKKDNRKKSSNRLSNNKLSILKKRKMKKLINMQRETEKGNYFSNKEKWKNKRKVK